MEHTAEWKYDDTLWDFIDMIKWCIVGLKLLDDDNDDLLEILRNPKLVEKEALTFGLTDRVAAEEILRIGEKANNLFLEFDKVEGEKVNERPEVFRMERKPRNLLEVLWKINSRCDDYKYDNQGRK